MPVNPDTGRNEIEHLNPRHFRIVDLAVAGLMPGQIADEVGCTRENVTLVLASPRVQHEIARRRGNVQRGQDDLQSTIPLRAKAYIESKSLAAAEKLADHMNSKDENVSMKAALSLLDRAMGTSKDSMPSHVTIIKVEQMNNLRMALRESKGEQAQLNEAPAEGRLPGQDSDLALAS